MRSAQLLKHAKLLKKSAGPVRSHATGIPRHPTLALCQLKPSLLRIKRPIHLPRRGCSSYAAPTPDFSVRLTAVISDDGSTMAPRLLEGSPLLTVCRLDNLKRWAFNTKCALSQKKQHAGGSRTAWNYPSRQSSGETVSMAQKGLTQALVLNFQALVD